jgi:hypothetical protein
MTDDPNPDLAGIQVQLGLCVYPDPDPGRQN